MVTTRASPTVAQRSSAQPSSDERDRAAARRERDVPTGERESVVAVIDLYPERSRWAFGLVLPGPHPRSFGPPRSRTQTDHHDRNRHNDQEEHPGGGRGATDIEVAQSLLVNVRRKHLRRVPGAA